MAYFSNGTEGMVFDDQCCRCIFGDRPCPIAWVQGEYNYKACNNDLARAILDDLVKQDGSCEMFKMAPDVFMTAGERGRASLFGGDSADGKESDHA